MYTIQNDLLKIEIKSAGAELSAITAVQNDNQFLWHADPKIWGSHAPNLFPIIGSMKDDSYFYNGKKYNMTKHGFVRHNKDLKLIDHFNNQIKFQLKSNEQLFEMYPFLFEFEISYHLNKNSLEVKHSVKNIDDKTLYFSLGGHPAFTCPLYNDEAYEDYFLEFEKNEISKSHKLNLKTGLVTDKTKSVFEDGNKIKLRNDLFDDDALIFKDLKSRKVTLKHHDNGTVLTLKFEDFPYLGIWAKPNAPYVCIEPWLGIADSEDTNQRIKEKEGIIALESGVVFNASYTIEIDQKHLA
ncbi:aldose 1-epimerase family protein [Winogradskyella ursingii]|uniref:aldose 1-epimerase family protein n=1 Tax=Winogradskyella ursingii TaxID=2686079 RepID=UPI0015C8EE7C|nr:aldose 1-epimerase family protein [Winogradskyella ursingii]